MTLRCEFSPSQTSKTYRKLKRECLKQGKLFIDSEFPPSNESLFLDERRWSGADLEIEWKRPGEIVDDPRLFVEGASPFDVTQGILGNCWFVSACSALTNSDALLCKVIPDGQEWDSTSNDYTGIFQFCFWRFGRWIDVIIDDLLPCRSGKLLFARSKTDNEFWSALLEKAFAKFYGCYENLVGGQLADALQDVSGGVAETLNVHRFISQHKKILNGMNSTEDLHLSKRLNNLANGNLTSLSVYKTGVSASKRLFYTLKHAFNREALIVAAISAKNDEVEKSLECVMGHAYALTSIQFIELDALQLSNKSKPDRGLETTGKRQAMVRLQNPWGEKEWNGPWSDGSAEWEQVTDVQKSRLGITANDDGEFWMPWEKFLEYFTDISVCQMLIPLELGVRSKIKSRPSIKASRRSNATIGIPLNRRYHEWNFYGRWTTNGVKSGAPQDRSGGCPNFSATFCFNPQFLLEFSGPGTAEVILALNQPDKFYGKKRLPYLAVGMQLMRVEFNRRHRLHRPLPSIATSEYSSGRSVHLHLDKLTPGRYILIPSSFAPKEEGEFLLRIYSTRQMNPRLLEEDTPVAALNKFGIRFRCLVRLQIREIHLHSHNKITATELFCRLSSSTGEQLRTGVAFRSLSGPSFKFDGESFIFHSLCPTINFTFDVFVKNEFHHRIKYIGFARLRVRADQNDRLRLIYY
uniref:Calpain catalytic domain-containing protein n=1 Tax=Meloidogyne enterolobii TaxID=390850 RepID=A0A6V7UY61_MELEN|nr:unnamed protein product [Meloidogyne enterolobii]